MSTQKKSILIISDGDNRPELSSDDRAALLARCSAFKSSGGIILVVGVRASGAGYAMLQQMASGGFFINVWGEGNQPIQDAIAYLTGTMCYYCAGPRPPVGYGGGCLDDNPIPPQLPDPTPLPDIESDAEQIFTSTKSVTVCCAAGTEPVSPVNLIPAMTALDQPAGVSASDQEPVAHPSWHAFDREVSTYWQGTDTAVYLRYAFLVSVILRRYEITPSSTDIPTAWFLEGTNDATFVTWNIVDTRVGMTLPPNIPSRFDIAPTTSYRYWRLRFPTHTGAPIKIVQLSMYKGNTACATASATATSNVSQADADAQATTAARVAATAQANCTQPQVPQVVFTPVAGASIGGGLDVTLSVPGFASAQIRFTQDGSQPPADPTFIFPSSILTGVDYVPPHVPVHFVHPINPSAVPTIKAIARVPGYADSIVASAVYVV